MAEAAAEYIINQVAIKPKVGIICGSGLGGIAEAVSEAVRIPYCSIEGFPVGSLPGHEGVLVIGMLGHVPVLIMKGRVHLYEGISLVKMTFPIRVMNCIGVDVVIISNAAGALNPDYELGDVMFINDHVNMPGLAGHSPLIDSERDRSISPFVNMCRAYDKDLLGQAKAAAKAAGLDEAVREGTHVMVAGPSYETPAECRYLRMLGGDAVGMSSVPEVLVAHQLGMRIFAFSLITDKCVMSIEEADNSGPQHKQVMERAEERQHVIQKFISIFVQNI